MKPRFGVALKDKNSKPKLKEELKGGQYDENPEILGRKMSKLSYNLTRSNGLQPGYLEKVESIRDERDRQT